MRLAISAKFSRIALFALWFILLLYACPSFAGEGKFNGSTMDINVLLDADNTWTDADLTAYFTRISQELYDATEKQVQLGEVNIFRGGPEAKGKADLLVSKKLTGAYTYPNGFGTAGNQGRIYLPETEVSSPGRPTVVHEMGHSVFGIYDSYLGYLQETVAPFRYWGPINNDTSLGWQTNKYKWNPNKAENRPSVIGVNLTDIFYDNPNKASIHTGSCIMDGPWSAETEFSTPAGKGWASDHLAPAPQNITMTYNGNTFPFIAKVITH